ASVAIEITGSQRRNAPAVCAASAICGRTRELEELRLGQSAVPCRHVRMRPRESLRETLHDVHRAVLSARATDGDRQVPAIAQLVLGNARLDEAGDVFDEAAGGFLGFEEAH